MKQITIAIFLLISFYSIKLKAQTQSAQEYLISCIREAKENGAVSIISSATFCSACRGEVTYEGFLFIKEASEIYKVRYLKYINRPASVKILTDKTFSDTNIKSIFKILETYQDSIIRQLSNIENLLINTVIENGEIIHEVSVLHGKLRYLRIDKNDNSVTSLQSIINLNEIFEKAYYYWLLNSSINNYYYDYFKLR